MAIFHLSHSFLKRSQRSSCVATAAYISGQRLEDSQGQIADYTRKGGVLYQAIMLPTSTPAWAESRGELWQRLEIREDTSTRAKDALLAHKFNIALPHELTLEQNIHLANDFIREQFVRKGYPVDWAIHSADPRGDGRNIHLHILSPLRKIEGESFGKKDRYNKTELRQQINTWRTAWANLTNRHLKRYGFTETIDERSFKTRGLNWIPTMHIGPLPKAIRYMLDSLRNKQAAQPTASIKRISQVIEQNNIPALAARTHNLTTDEVDKNQAPRINQKPKNSKAWPPEAVIDWEVWGHKNPRHFFQVWPELKSEGFSHTKCFSP